MNRKNDISLFNQYKVNGNSKQQIKQTVIGFTLGLAVSYNCIGHAHPQNDYLWKTTLKNIYSTRPNIHWPFMTAKWQWHWFWDEILAARLSSCHVTSEPGSSRACSVWRQWKPTLEIFFLFIHINVMKITGKLCYKHKKANLYLSFFIIISDIIFHSWFTEFNPKHYFPPFSIL